MSEVGDKVKFDAEKQRYTVQARDDRFVILTKPFNARQTYLYTIADLEKGIRGACNLIFGPPKDCDTPHGGEVCLKWLRGFQDEFGWNEMSISDRNQVPLSQAEIDQLKGKSQ